MKKIIDAKSELQAPQASIRYSSLKRRTKDEDILGVSLTCESSKIALKELIGDIRFVSGHRISPLIAFETLLHFWLLEIQRAPRIAVAARLNSARKFAHQMRQQEMESVNDEYEAIAERLLNALSKPMQADEGVSNV